MAKLLFLRENFVKTRRKTSDQRFENFQMTARMAAKAVVWSVVSYRVFKKIKYHLTTAANPKNSYS